MRKSYALIIGAVVACSALDPAVAGDGRDFHPIEWDLRTLPALGFFPVGGNLRLTGTQLSSYVLGVAIDMFNFTDHNVRNRMTLLNASAYLAGVNYVALLENTDHTDVFSLAYLRMGPHYRWQEMYKEKGILSVGAQMGAGMVVQGSTEEGQSRFLYGLDVSFTLTWTPFRELVAHRYSAY